MFEGSTPQDTDPALPHAATRCMRACSCDDHATAERLRARSSGENGKARNKRRSIRLKRRAAAGEADAIALAGEAR